MKFSIENPLQFNDVYNTTAYPFSIQGIEFWGIFATEVVAGLDIDLLREVEEGCGIKLSEQAYQFKFDRLENIENDTYFRVASGAQRLTYSGVSSLGEVVVQCFELHHQLTGCHQYYSLAIEEKRARFYNRVAMSSMVQDKGFNIHCGLGSDKLAYVITRS